MKSKYFAIFRQNQIVTTGNTVGFELEYFYNLQRESYTDCELKFSETPFPRKQNEVGNIFGMTFQQILDKQQKH